MVDRPLGFSLIPQPWAAPFYPAVIQYVVVHWLYREVDPLIEIKLPVLRTIHGYRNIEVYGYLASTKDFRDARTCLAVYGDAYPRV